MDARIKLLLKKTRPLQLLFLVVAVVCLLVFLVFNFSMNDRAGAFEVRQADQQVEIPVTRAGLTDLTIEASGVRLEVGMVSSLSKPQVILSGERYSDQIAKVDLEGTACTVALQNSKLSGDINGLTMQVLLPQSDYHSITVNGAFLNLHVEDLRTNFLGANVGSDGYAYFADVKADRMVVSSEDSPLRFYDNQLAKLTAESSTGSVTFLENDIESADIETESGGVFCYNTRVNGQWNVESLTGDVTMLSKNLPYNLLIEAVGSNVDIGYDSRYWKDADETILDTGLVITSVGNNPNKFIQVNAMAGNVVIGQRERYSDLDPYAADYPFADTNPYLIERSTITK